jgi:hypothetical protein
VDQGAHWNRRQGEVVARLDVGLVAGDHGVADIQVERGQDVALLAVCVVQEGDVRGAVRIVLERRDNSRNLLFAAGEVDDPILALVSTTGRPTSKAMRSSCVASSADPSWESGPRNQQRSCSVEQE